MRLTTIAASAAALALTAGGMAVAVADPGPNGNNTFGLCTAYYAGSDKGKEHKRQAPPFKALEEAAEAEFGDEADPVAAYCAEYGQHPGNGGGKPE